MADDFRGLRPILRSLNRHKTVIAALVVLLTGIGLLISAILSGDDVSWSSFSKEIGIVLATSGVAALVYDFALRRSFLDEMTLVILDSIAGLRSSGLVAIHEGLPDEFALRAGEKASRSIKILQTWIGNLIQIEPCFKKAISRTRTCRVEILLLDPESPQAIARGEDYGFSKPETVRDHIYGNLQELIAVCRRDGIAKNVEIRLFSGTPVISLYSYDDTMFLGIYWKNLGAIQGPQVEIRSADSYLGRTVGNYWAALWKEAKPYPLEPRT